MRRAALTATLVASICSPAGATASPPELRGLLEAERPSGCSDYSYLFWDLYRAELWTDATEPPGEAYALSLVYRSEFSRSELVDSSVEEMARLSSRPQPSLDQARSELEQAFRDVAPGDRITAWRAGPDRLRIFVNGRETGALTRDVDLFLDIWFGERTRYPAARQAMLEGRCDG